MERNDYWLDWWMFGFFKKSKPPVQTETSAKAISPPVPDDGNPIHAAISQIRAKEVMGIFKLFDGLATGTVSLLVSTPGDMRTSLCLEMEGQPYIPIFTKPEFASKWIVESHPHLLELKVTKLCTAIKLDTMVGLTINPDHPQFGYPLNADQFQNLRAVLIDSSLVWSEGGLYAVRNEDGSFSVIKILVLDDAGVHIRAYSNRFPESPRDLNPDSLYITDGDRKPGDSLGIGHLPIMAETFASWKPTYLQRGAEVVEGDLDGYRMWQEARGGYFTLALPEILAAIEKARNSQAGA